MISSITLLRIKVEKNRMSAITAIAPAIAPASTETNPDKLNAPAETVPPSNSITIATPNPAPELTPSMDAPASGLRKAVCNNSPHADSALPASIAVTAWGKRASRTM